MHIAMTGPTVAASESTTVIMGEQQMSFPLLFSLVSSEADPTSKGSNTSLQGIVNAAQLAMVHRPRTLARRQ